MNKIKDPHIFANEMVTQMRVNFPHIVGASPTTTLHRSSPGDLTINIGDESFGYDVDQDYSIIKVVALTYLNARQQRTNGQTPFTQKYDYK